MIIRCKTSISVCTILSWGVPEVGGAGTPDITTGRIAGPRADTLDGGAPG